MSRSPGFIFTIIGAMMLPTGIVFLLMIKPIFLGVTFLILSIANLLLGVLFNKKNKNEA